MSRFAHILLLALVTSQSATSLRGQDIAIKDGQKLAFLGDSITLRGWSSPGGYVQLVVAGLKANGITVVPIPAGISGQTSRDMLARVGRSVLSQKPDWMTLSCGVNDVWHGSVSLAAYQSNVTAIVDQARAAGVQVMILTATPIKEDLTNTFNKTLAAYNDCLRTLAKDKHCRLADLNADAQVAIRAGTNPGRVLTVDGVHMNPRGDELMATGILNAFGMSAAQLQQARQVSAAIPHVWDVQVIFPFESKKHNVLTLDVPLSRSQYEKLETVAAKQPYSQSVGEMLNLPFWQDVRALLKPKGPYENLDAIFDAHKDKEILNDLQQKLTARMDALLKDSTPTKTQ